MILIFLVILTAFFIMLGIRLRNILEDQMADSANTLVRTTTREEKRLIDAHFSEIEKIGAASAEYFEMLIRYGLLRQEDPLFDQKYKMVNGAIRTNPAALAKSDISGLFVSSRARLTSQDKKIISAMELYFSSYSKGIRNSVYNNYFISKDQFIRIYPPRWAMEVESDHDFTKDIFFAPADPENNPDKKPVWTPVYYDSIWKTWMTSLLVPVYLDGEFMGIIGHDLELSAIYRTILGKKHYHSGYGFIFDSNENIIVHPANIEKLRAGGSVMGQRLAFAKLEDGKIKQAVEEAVRSLRKNKTVFYSTIREDSGNKYFFHACKLDFMDWHYGIILEEKAVFENIAAFNMEYFHSVLGFGIFFFLVVIFVIWYYIVAPINGMAKAAQLLGKADFDYRIPAHSKDEIGDLALAFNNTAASLKSITTSRDSLNRQIQERIKTEEELEKFKAASDGANCGIAILAKDGSFEYVNEYYSDIHGYQTDEVIGKNIKLFHSGEQFGHVTRLIEKLRAGRQVSSEEVWHKHKDGHVFPMLMNLYKIHEYSHDSEFIAVTAIEISELKKAEQRRFELERVISLSNAIVFVWENKEGWPVKYVSENVKKVLGYSSEMFYSGKLKFFDMVCDEDIPFVTVHEDSSRKDFKFLSRQYRIRKKSGSLVWVDDRILIRRNKSGKIIHYEGIIIDVSDKKKAEELNRQKREAEDANRAKSEFIANMSHEIRTPMNAILGFTEIVLASQNLTEENKTALSVVKDSGEALLRIINDILDISKIEAGKMDISPYPFSLRQSLDMSLKSFSLSCSNKGLDFSCRIPVEIPDMLLGDSIRLRQVLVNLVGNAAKFTARGGIYVNVTREFADDENIILIFEVRDSGIGIPHDKKEIIFEAFMQADSSTTRQYGGTGLGLAICSRLVSMMGGRIWVESEVGKGSSFFFSVPFKICRELPSEGEGNSAPALVDSLPKRSPSDIKIMLAEDNSANQELVKMIFSLNSISNLTIVNNGIEAVEAFSREKFDIVFLDIHMPGLNGFEAVKKLREINPDRRSCVIIAMTACAGEDEHRKCLDGGMDDYISKPVTEKKLIEKIEECCRKLC